MEVKTKLTEAFFDYLHYERGASEKTLEGYRNSLKAFELFFKSLDSNLDWDNVDIDVAREWTMSMMENGNKATSVATRLSALRSCYKFLFRRGLIDSDPFHNLTAPKAERPLPAFIRDKDMERLLDGEDTFSDDGQGLLEKAVIETFYDTGIRLSELVGLNIDDVNMEQNTIHVTGKGNKQRIVPFGEKLRETLNIYIKCTRARRTAEEKAFFISMKGERMKPKPVRDMVRAKLALVTDQQKRSPHILRHSFATTMLNHKANLEAVKELMGHERLATTEIYTHTTFEELRRVYQQAHPRA